MSADNIMYLIEENDGSFTGYECTLSALDSAPDTVPFAETVQRIGRKHFTAPDMRSAVKGVEDYQKENTWHTLEYGYEFILKESK